MNIKRITLCGSCEESLEFISIQDPIDPDTSVDIDTGEIYKVEISDPDCEWCH